jgi:UDP-2-acetamido-3-amino-2,3-dideoxy-glucuronate N-acetyltransferase
MKNIAVIGAGKWGKNIISTLEKMNRVNLKYLCARDQISLAPFSNEYTKLTDWHVLLSKNDLDAVIIATPASTHTSMAISFLEKNIAVFVEKPMSLSIAEAKKLKKASEKSKAVFMVGYQYVFNQNVDFIKKEILNKKIEAISFMKTEHIKSPTRSDIDIFWDVASHPLSIYQHLFGQPRIKSVKGKMKPDFVSAEVSFENAPKLKIKAANEGEKKIRQIAFETKIQKILIDETLEEKKLSISKNGKTNHPKIVQIEPLLSELNHFVECLEKNHPPVTNINFGFQVTEWMETICKALKNK